MARRVWFENAYGEEKIIQDTAETWHDVCEAIKTFIDRCNHDKIIAAKDKYGDNYQEYKVNLFHWYYTRTWKQKDGRIRIDVGSHTEFFIWEGDIENEISARNR